VAFRQLKTPLLGSQILVLDPSKRYLMGVTNSTQRIAPSSFLYEERGPVAVNQHSTGPIVEPLTFLRSYRELTRNVCVAPRSTSDSSRLVVNTGSGRGFCSGAM